MLSSPALHSGKKNRRLDFLGSPSSVHPLFGSGFCLRLVLITVRVRRSHRWVQSPSDVPNRRFFVRHLWARAKLGPSASNRGALTAPEGPPYPWRRRNDERTATIMDVDEPVRRSSAKEEDELAFPFPEPYGCLMPWGSLQPLNHPAAPEGQLYTSPGCKAWGTWASPSPEPCKGDTYRLRAAPSDLQ